ncbi:MFS transporter [Streptomyces sp. SL13]|uniref:MFS transporter n=1 Tax=Streptantibioticus silvisoli TaxID=2705255 RepID=A0AA90KCC4_9ACTN|nr:MFS transporter [Streptantibioticus silvisoli]MDI5965932.1 MFS transporter [Streptantibioticus silvisoli]MDI5974307.1 MFS transporter [Streptantibioticus silvisoli]
MLAPYRAIFAAPGARGFSVAGAVGRLPLSMLGIGIVTMISQVTGRYGLAGALSATVALAAAAFGPRVSRLVDRYGQRRVLRPVAAVTVLAVAGLVVCVRLNAPVWTLFVCAAAAGSTPSLGSMVRARWAALYRGSPLLHAAYSYESVIDEFCFIIGPIVSIGLCTGWFPEAGPLLAALCLAGGVLSLTAQRSTEPVPHPREEHQAGGSALRSPGLRVLVLTFVATGAIFGSADVVTVAFAQALGHKAAASLPLAVYSLGSCLAGVVFGLVAPRRSPARRFLVGVCTMAVSMIPLQLVGNLPELAAALFVAGLSVAPTMVTTMALVEQHVPRSRLTEGMTWTSTGLAIGVAAGSWAAGAVVDAAGPTAGFTVPLGAGTLAAVVALVGYRRLRPAPEREEQRGDELDANDRRDDLVA